MPQHYRGPSPQGKTPCTSKSTNGASRANGTRSVSAAHGEGRVRSAKAAYGGPRAYGGSVAHGGSQSFPQGAYSAVKPAGAQRNNPSSTSQYSRSNPNYQKKNRKGSRGKKISIAVVLAVLVVFVGAGTAAALWVNSVNDTLTKGQKSATELDEINDVLVKTTSFDEPFYMMLIGSDARADDESMGARSDTNIVVRVDPTTNSATR